VDDALLEGVSHIVRTRRGELAALARSEGVTAEDAVDCVQEALCTLLGLARKGELPDDHEAWGGVLVTIVRNVARNRRRRHFRARPHDDIDVQPIAAAAMSAEAAIARAEEHVRLRMCVDELCEIQKAVVTLRMLEEKPGEDVARTLGITPGHVAVLLHRAKASLRACMRE
jgi:RNA polymerase sigma-70 factor (ECF subfamily)